MLNRSRSRFLTAVVIALVSLLDIGSPPRAENIRQPLVASAARTAAGQGSAVDVTRCKQIFALVSVTAGSGTVSTFRVYLEGSIDGGTTWAGLSCPRQSKRVASGPTVTFILAAGAGEGLIVNETAAVTAATTYAVNCDVNTDTVRLGWEIAGTTPSETFSADLVCK